MLAQTPKPPYYAVIFSSVKTSTLEDYAAAADRMVELAAEQEGFLGIESADEEIGITVSYWKDEQSILSWRTNAEHLFAQEMGKEKWYAAFETRVAKVERAYSFRK